MRFRRSLVLLLFCILFSAWSLLYAGNFLSSPAQQPVTADAMFVLGGDGGARTLRGIELYRSKYSPLVVLTGLEDAEPSAQPYYLNWRSQILIAAGVPKNSIEFDAVSKSSREEAVAALKLARQRGWKRVLVVSDPPHMRRLLWIWSKTFKGSGIDVVLVAGTPWWWNAEKWWTSEASARFVVSEYIKLGYYWMKYGVLNQE
jgi:uncharacterized SAM-binding protein YcdF (DUF218 family)